MYNHVTDIQLRFSDMDAFGHINNACYLTYFEEARISYMDEIVGLEYKWSARGIILANAEINFLKPTHIKDSVKVFTRCIHLGSKSFTLDYKMVRGNGENEEVVALCTSVQVMFDYDKQATVLMPEEWKALIKKFESITQ